MHETNHVAVIDFGSQYTMLIARRIREQRVYCEIWPFDRPLSQIKAFAPAGIILSGGNVSIAFGIPADGADRPAQIVTLRGYGSGMACGCRPILRSDVAFADT